MKAVRACISYLVQRNSIKVVDGKVESTIESNNNAHSLRYTQLIMSRATHVQSSSVNCNTQAGARSKPQIQIQPSKTFSSRVSSSSVSVIPYRTLHPSLIPMQDKSSVDVYPQQAQPHPNPPSHSPKSKREREGEYCSRDTHCPLPRDTHDTSVHLPHRRLAGLGVGVENDMLRVGRYVQPT